MQLPTCPSCGQSVLEDDVAECPFCGAAMDGSRPGKPPQKSSSSKKPKAEKPAEPPAKPRTAAASAVGRGRSQIVVDEDDPFGISSSGSADAVQAAPRPSRGKLKKVVCPMCEKPGFIPRGAIGKSVRCANPKCMVPVFTAVDPESDGENKAVRLADQEEAARRAEAANAPKKRSPVMLYAIVGFVVIGLAGFAVTQLAGESEPTEMIGGVDLSQFSEMAEAEDQRKRDEAVRKAKQAAEKKDDPAVIAEQLISRMTVLARQNLRDKALARRFTADLWLRLQRRADAARELNQLAVVNRRSSFYQVIPMISDFWRLRKSGDSDSAAASLKAATDELGQRSFPGSGRAAAEAVLTTSAALVASARSDEALQLIQSRQQDQTIELQRDSMVTQAWLYLADTCLDLQLRPPAVSEAFQWGAPLHTAVAGGLAAHGSWAEAVAWAAAASTSRQQSDGLVLIADFARQKKPDQTVFKQLQKQADALSVPALALRVRAAVAAASGDAELADTCRTQIQEISVGDVPETPTLGDLVRTSPAVNLLPLNDALAVAETARALLLAGESDAAAAAIEKLVKICASIAPSTTTLRQMTSEASQQQAAFRRKIQAAMLENDDRQTDKFVRRFSSNVAILADAAEDRRAELILQLARVAGAGGAATIVKACENSEYLAAELALDETSGLIAQRALLLGQDPDQLETVVTPAGTLRITHGENAVLLQKMAVVTVPAWGRITDDPGRGLLAFAAGDSTLPGIKQCLGLEFSSRAGEGQDAAVILDAITGVPKAIWQESLLIQAGLQLGRRGLRQDCLNWLSTTKLGSMEQISLLYGVTAAVVEKAAASRADTPAADAGGEA